GVNPTLSGEEATEHGGAWHLKRHVQHRPVAYRLPSDPASKGCLPHAGCGTDGNEIPDLEAADDRVQVWQAGRQADEFPLARTPLLECLVSELGHRGRVVMVIRPYRIEDAGLDAVKGFRYVVWQAERLILALLTGVDHLSETGVLGDDPSVVGHAAGGRDGGDKREQVRLAPELLQLTSTPQGVRQRHRVHWLALASKIHHEPEHLGMRRPVEVARCDNSPRRQDRLLGEQAGPQHRLLRLEVVRRDVPSLNRPQPSGAHRSLPAT